MTNNFVVLMMGYTGSGKSTVAKKIANALDAEIHHSALIRKKLGYTFTQKEAESDFFLMTSKNREPMDRAVYAELAKCARQDLLKGKNVVIDASHFFKWQRENLYRTILDLKPEVFIVSVKCPEKQILLRLRERSKVFLDSPLHETPSIRAYKSSKIAIEDPEGDAFEINPTIIEYNTHTGKLEVKSPATGSNLNRILSVLQ